MVDYPDAQIPCLVIEYLRKTEEFRNFACLYGAQIDCFKQKHVCRKSRDTVPLSIDVKFY